MRRSKFMQRLRRYLMMGLIVIAPIGVTAFVLIWLFESLDPILGQYLSRATGREFPGLGLVALLTILICVGWASQKALGRRALGAWNALLSRLPLASKLYGGSSQIVRSVLDREGRLFRSVGLVEYPQPGSYALVFETADVPAEIEAIVGEPAVSVFLPTSPNPTSGYWLLMPRSRIRKLHMTVEEGLKMVLSAGVALPDAAVAVPETVLAEATGDAANE